MNATKNYYSSVRTEFQTSLSVLQNQLNQNQQMEKVRIELRIELKVISIKPFHPYREAYLEHLLIKYLCQSTKLEIIDAIYFSSFFIFFPPPFFSYKQTKS